MPDFDLDAAFNRPVTPSFEEVTFRIEPCPEDDGMLPPDAFPPQDDNAADQDANERMLEEIEQRLRNGDLWAFSTVCVAAMWADPDTNEEFEGTDYLGCCSYVDEADFRQEGGYYRQMQEAAYADLLHKIETANGHAH